MNVDYAAIANADPGGDLNSAFATMAALTEAPVSKGEYQVNQTDLVRMLTLEDATTLRKAFEFAVGLDQLPPWFITALDRDGVNICHPQLTGKIPDMVSAGKLSQDQADSFLALGIDIKKTFPRLSHGQLQNAREKLAGEF